jgi:hypothetical protein
MKIAQVNGLAPSFRLTEQAVDLGLLDRAVRQKDCDAANAEAPA